MSQNKNTGGGARRGFTLVEVIVVAVIVLILAAVAIPMYNGYVKSTRREAVANLAETAAAAANSYWRKTNTNPALSSINIYYNAGKHTITIGTDNVVVTENTENVTNPCTATSYYKGTTAPASGGCQ